MRPRSSSATRMVCGINPVANLVKRDASRIVTLYVQHDLGAKRRARLGRGVDKLGHRVREVSRRELDTLAEQANHQGVVAEVEAGTPLDEAAALSYVASLERPLLLVLDGIEDPRNFGACLRTAAAAGADLVVTGRSRAVSLTPAASKVAAGAAEIQPRAEVANLARFLAGLAELGVRIIGTDGSATPPLFSQPLDAPVALILGSEGRGLRRLTRERCDAVVSLPLADGVESLNISVAAGICLYEAIRQRLASAGGLG